MNKWTKKEWEKHLAINGYDTYDLAVPFAALCIKEFGEKKGLKMINGLSGFQAQMAYNLAKLIPNIK